MEVDSNKTESKFSPRSYHISKKLAKNPLGTIRDAKNECPYPRNFKICSIEAALVYKPLSYISRTKNREKKIQAAAFISVFTVFPKNQC